MKNYYKLIIIFILALSLRIFGLNWDQGQHLHPDERFLTMVTADIKLPSTIFDYFNTSLSPLNPYNYPSYKFFVYGTLPIFLVKVSSVWLHLDNYENIVFVGRVLSAVVDSFNIILLYLLSINIFKNKKQIYIASLLYALCVLPLQLSHFFTVDTFLSTLLLATFTLLVYNLFPLAAITFGLALACKVSAIYFVPIIFIFIFFKPKTIIYGILTVITFRIFQPYAFIGLINLNPDFINSLKTLAQFSKTLDYYPPGVQWLSIGNPLLFSLKNIVFWGLGLPLTIGILFSIKKLNNKIIYISLFWILLLFAYQGSQTTPTMRYFLPIYPFLCLFFAYLSKDNKYQKIFIIFHLIFGLLFLNIYSHNHTRVDASKWIYQNVPSGSIITNEYWDDPLPLNIKSYNASVYNGLTLSPYDPDSAQKIDNLYSQINSADYIVMSSNRLWHSIPFSTIYPLTSKYYSDLFSGKLNFIKVFENNSYPGLSLPLDKCYYFGPTNFPGIKNDWFSIDSNCLYPGIYLRDDSAEEAFTVYDHPKVLIFQKQK